MFSQTTCVAEKVKYLKAQLDSHVLFELWTPQVYPKIAQNAKFAVNHLLRWNNSSLITNWETILTLNNEFRNYRKVSGATP